MAYDIYGNDLRRGYCEVHPSVNEEYPCSLCHAEIRYKEQERRRQDEFDRQQRERYENLQRREVDAAAAAIEIAERVQPPLSVNEQAFFVAGFTECIKWLNQNNYENYETTKNAGDIRPTTEKII